MGLYGGKPEAVGGGVGWGWAAGNSEFGVLARVALPCPGEMNLRVGQVRCATANVFPIWVSGGGMEG